MAISRPCVSYPSQSEPSICGSCQPPGEAWHEVRSVVQCPELTPAAAVGTAEKRGCSSQCLSQ